MELKNIDEKWLSDKLEFLLTTKGNEKGFGVCFAKKFVQKIQNKSNCALQNSMVIREYPISVSKSTKFIDILYLDLDKKDNVVIAVENKFLTQDSKNQLDNYVTALNSLFSQNDVKVVYLTLDDRKPINYQGDDVVCLSWLDDILEMVLECVFKTEIESISDDIITKWKNKNKQSIRNEIISLINTLIQIRNLNEECSDDMSEMETIIKEHILKDIFKQTKIANHIKTEYLGKCIKVTHIPSHSVIFIPMIDNPDQITNMLIKFAISLSDKNKNITPTQEQIENVKEKIKEILKSSDKYIKCSIQKYLKTKKDECSNNFEKIDENQNINTDVSTIKNDIDTKISTLKDTFEAIGMEFSDEECKQILNKVNYNCEQEGFSRDQILVKMYGDIVNPKTGKKFSIPTLDYLDPNYVIKYARYMQRLVERPQEFIRIMNWD